MFSTGDLFYGAMIPATFGKRKIYACKKANISRRTTALAEMVAFFIAAYSILPRRAQAAAFQTTLHLFRSDPAHFAKPFNLRAEGGRF